MFADDESSAEDASSALTMAEQITLSTVRLECPLSKDTIRRGTGFFYRFALADGSPFPAIITNAHVLDGVRHVTFHVCAGDAEGRPLKGNHHTITIDDIS